MAYKLGRKGSRSPISLKTLELKTKAGRSFKIDFPLTRRRGVQSSIVFAYPKSGSVMIDGIIRQICESKNIPNFALSNELFSVGTVPIEVDYDLGELFDPEGLVYYSHRDYPYEYKIKGIDCFDKIIFVRDPRDMLVSLYFSWTKSHGAPDVEGEQTELLGKMRDKASDMDIDAFCIEQGEAMYMNQFNRYAPHMRNGRWRIYRYNDFIFNKPALVRALAKDLRADLGEATIDEIAASVDVLPKAEDQSSHVRRVHPGDHVNKLRPETILKLNEILAPFMEYYGFVGDAAKAGCLKDGAEIVLP